MKIGIKGIIDLELMTKSLQNNVEFVAFDLRPKSFNFTQEYKIAEILEQNSNANLESVSLLFENEKTFMIQEICNRLSKDFKITAEFTGKTDLKTVDDLVIDFFWHFDQDTKIKEVFEAKNLKRIVLTQEVLEQYQDNNELYGLINMFQEQYEVEIQGDWDKSIIKSAYDLLNIRYLSFEINNKVERSYRNIDYGLLEAHIGHVSKLFNQQDKHETTHK